MSDITITITLPASAIADVLAVIATHATVEREVDYTAADAPAASDDLMTHLAGLDAAALPLAPITGACGTCGAAYRWFPGENPPNHCACGGDIAPADIAPPQPFGDVPGDIPFGDDHIDSGVTPDPEADAIAAAADTFAQWLAERNYVSPTAAEAFQSQDSSGHWRTRLFEAGYEEWADGSWHRAIGTGSHDPAAT